MKNYKKILSFIIAFAICFTGVFGGNYSYANDKVVNSTEEKIRLEDGSYVTEEEFVKILEEYEGEIYQVDTNSGNITNTNNSSMYNINRPATTNSVAIGDLTKIMAGTWYIPGIGKVVVVGGAIIIGGISIYKVSGWLANKVRNWLQARATKKVIEDALKRFGSEKNGKVNHVDVPRHNWSKLVPGTPKGPKRWRKIKEIIERVMKNGREERYKGVYKKVLKIAGETVEVTFIKNANGTIDISNGWVK